eukprot:scaffold1044_cov266-Pinguiococcus_pyrenoidosus.AAC.5
MFQTGGFPHPGLNGDPPRMGFWRLRSAAHSGDACKAQGHHTSLLILRLRLSLEYRETPTSLPDAGLTSSDFRRHHCHVFATHGLATILADAGNIHRSAHNMGYFDQYEALRHSGVHRPS